MAPAKPRANGDDSHGATSNGKSDTTNGKDKNGHHGNGTSSNSKQRRGAGSASTAAALASAAAAAAAAATAASATQANQAHETALNGTGAGNPAAGPPNPTIRWTDFQRGVLHAYRRAYHLNTPAAFSNDFHHWILTQPGSIGLQSPSMVRRKELRRQSKNQLASATRKHFNGLGVQENDIIVDFLHKVQSHEVKRLNRLRRMGSNSRETDG